MIVETNMYNILLIIALKGVDNNSKLEMHIYRLTEFKGITRET
jgi:hypothetical protein